MADAVDMLESLVYVDSAVDPNTIYAMQELLNGATDMYNVKMNFNEKHDKVDRQYATVGDISQFLIVLAKL